MLKPIFAEEVRGQAEIREIFRSSKFGNIAGCMIIDGSIKRNQRARLLRDGVVVAETSIGIPCDGKRTMSLRFVRASNAA